MSSSQKKPRVLALSSLKYAGVECIEEFMTDFDVDILNVKTRPEAITAIAASIARNGPYLAFMVLMGTRPFFPFDSTLLSSLAGGNCKLIVCAAAGYNEFDIDWLTANGIWFCNTRNSISEPTADMAIFLTLAVIRDASRAEKEARSGRWRGDVGFPCLDPYGLTMGIIGAGAIGKVTRERRLMHQLKLLTRKAAVFNMKVCYHNRTRLPLDVEKFYNMTYCPTLPSLLAISDVVSVNCPLNATTKHLISHAEFAQMKDGVFIVNTARGPIIDEEALIAAMESGKVNRVGLDVFENEPVINEYFRESDRCTLQPHLGGLTDKAFRDAERECFANIRALVATGRPVAPVNEIRVAN